MKKQRKFKHAKPQKKESLHRKKTHLIPQKEVVYVDKKPAESNVSFFNKLLQLRIPKIKKEKQSKPRTESAFSKWLKRHDSDIQLILFPSILLVILIILSVFNSQIFLSIPNQQAVTDDQTGLLHPYPYVQAVSAPNISAKAAIILDRASQVVLYSKNPQIRFSMASTTKIMTALTALDYFRSYDILTVKRANGAGVDGSGLGLYPGEQFRFIDLMYAMLLPSANDAAQAIADNYPGGSEAFVNQMNEKAQILHLTNTHYADPVGLDDDGDYSTVVDMARLASYAISNPTFVEITSTKYKTISNASYTKQYPLTSTNELLGIDGVNGIKTGTTEGAGEVLVTSTIKNGHTYIIVVMDSTNRFYDTSLLLNFIDTNVKFIVPSSPQTNF